MNEQADNSPQKFPLCWPDAFARTAPHERAHSRFGEKTIAQAWEFLHAEMRRLIGGNRDWYMSSNIPRSTKGAPRSDGQTRLADPGVAVYFKIGNKPVSLACDKWLAVQDNIYALAKHIEALRGQDRWGVGTIEQAFRGYMALPGIGGTSGMQWWKELGVAINASPDIVRKAYLAKAKEFHPDNQQTGDREKFQLIQLAWQQFRERTETPVSKDDATIITLAAALEAALMQIPTGEITFVCDLSQKRWEDWPVKILKGIPPDGTPDPNGCYFKAKVYKGYRMVKRGDYEGIQCLRCERVSFHPEDIKQKFCANCNMFHTDEEKVERLKSNGRLIDLT